MTGAVVRAGAAFHAVGYMILFTFSVFFGLCQLDKIVWHEMHRAVFYTASATYADRRQIIAVLGFL